LTSIHIGAVFGAQRPIDDGFMARLVDPRRAKLSMIGASDSFGGRYGQPPRQCDGRYEDPCRSAAGFPSGLEWRQALPRDYSIFKHGEFGDASCSPDA
jgi:hypothetical protein